MFAATGVNYMIPRKQVASGDFVFHRNINYFDIVALLLLLVCYNAFSYLITKLYYLYYGGRDYAKNH